eukprot:scaffold55451_cov20-Tisochrysis_lutea.AAC.2
MAKGMMPARKPAYTSQPGSIGLGTYFSGGTGTVDVVGGASAEAATMGGTAELGPGAGASTVMLLPLLLGGCCSVGEAGLGAEGKAVQVGTGSECCGRGRTV